MYTVVLMMAMTGNAETTTFGGRRCNGCNGGGCHGAVASSCHGGNGCHGRRMRGCNGGGCHGGCHGGGSGCHGGHGGCHGGCHTSNGNGYVVVQPRRINGAEEQSETGPMPNGQVRNGTAPATIIINLPAEARLTVDGQATTSTSGRRVFMSPPLATGSEYFYTVNAEIMRNGQPVTVTRRVAVTAGRETTVTLDFDRDTNGNAQPRQVTPARGEAEPARQLPRELPNLEQPKNNPNRQPQPNP